MENRDEIKDQIAELDKKIGILINTVEHGNDSTKSFINKTTKDIDRINDRLRALEIKQATNEANNEDFKTVKTSIIRVVIGGMAGIIAIACVMIEVIIKQG